MDIPIMFWIFFNALVFLMLTLDLGAVCKMFNHNHATGGNLLSFRIQKP